MVAKKPEQLDPNSPETTAGAALQGYDAMYRALFENMLDVYYRTDIDGHIEVISPSCLPQTGYSQEELIGRKTTEFYADPVQRDALLNELAKRGRVNDFDITLVHKNGTTRVASVTSHLVPGKDGRPSGVEGILRDVTARKHAENQLLNLNARLESTSDLLQEIIASIPVAIFWKDRDSRFLGCNQRFALDAGYSSPEEMIGKTDADMVWKDQASLYRADDAAVMASGTPKLDYEEPKAGRDGTTHWLRTSKVPLRDRDKQVIGVLGIFEDITGRKLADERLRLSEKRYRVLFEQATDYVLVLAEDGENHPIIIDANQAAFEKHGYTADELIGKPISFLDVGVSRDQVLERLRLLRTGKVAHFESEHRCKDGSTFWAEVTARLVNAGAKNMIYTVERDITGRKEAEKAQDSLLRENRKLVRQLMQVQEEERRLLARDLHDELGQLLTGIDARAEYIARHAQDSYLRTMAAEILRDTRASFDASHATILRLRPGSLDTLGITAALTELTGQWSKQIGIDCSLRIDGKIDHLDDIHAITIYRLVQEGLTNAHRHSQANRVNVSIRKIPAHAVRRGQVHIEINDNGKGIQTQNPTRGMGIIGMRERVYALGGTFLLSNMPGDGVRIEAVLPLDPVEEGRDRG